MFYPISEIFCSIQGEGFHTGKPAVFIRLAGCNLRPQCSWCDTNHTAKKKMTSIEIAIRVEQLSRRMTTVFIVLTGGEPTIHDLYFLCTQLRKQIEHTYIAIETNGTNPIKLHSLMQAKLLDWIAISPKYQTPFKSKFKVGLVEADEVKIVLDGKINPIQFESLLSSKLESGKCFIQPCSGKFRDAVDFVLEHPRWRLSLQMQKIVNIR